MNHIYRVVYNSATNTYQAVPENSTGKHKTASEKSSCAVSDVSEKGAFFSLKPMALCAMAMGLSSTGAWAAPTGGHISAGDASISQHGKITNIQQNSQKAAINWQTFGIKADETVNFKQPNAQAVILNRVIGNEKSVIDGAMNANGKVFISNPNGMIFGKNAQINVGALLATTAKIKDQDFMNGFFKFDQATGNITQLGDIKVPTGGVVALIAPIVANKGNITAPQGKVLLASAEQFSITLPDNGQFAYTLDRGTLQGLVDNGGAILADGGHVILTAKGTDAVKKSLIKHTGKIEANTVQNKNGVIELLGDLDNSRLEVSGSLKAEAKENGDGGFIETSAADVKIQETAQISTQAKNGKGGKYLLDPNDLIVGAGGTMTGGQVETALQNNGDFELKSTNGKADGKGDVIINDEISWNKGKLTLNAQNDIHINKTLNGTGTAKLALEYGQGTTNGGQSDYYLDKNTPLKDRTVKVNLPEGKNFSTKKGSNGQIVEFDVIHTMPEISSDGKAKDFDIQNIAFGKDMDLSYTENHNGFAGWGLKKKYQSGSDLLGGEKIHGLGHTVQNLTLDAPNQDIVGLFRKAEKAELRDLNLRNAKVKGQHYIGTLAGSLINSQVSNIHVNRSSILGAHNIGGIVGYVENNSGTNSQITNLHSNVKINASEGRSVGGAIGTVSGSGYEPTLTNINDVTATGEIRVAGGGDVVGGTGGLIGTLNLSSAGNKEDKIFVSNSSATGNVIAPNARGVGGFIGHIQNYGDKQIVVQNSFATGNVEGYYETGGFIGATEKSTIANNYATGNVSGSSSGGLVGRLSRATIQNSYATGNLKATNSNNVLGGLVGYADQSQIKRSYATGNITADGKNITSANSVTAGGLVGNNWDSDISESYATGNIHGTDFELTAGGLVGKHSGGSNIENSYATGDVSGLGWRLFLGGLIGNVGDRESTVSNTYATGKLTAPDEKNTHYQPNGLVGSHNYDSTKPLAGVSDSYFNKETVGTDKDFAGGKALTTAEMQNKASFANWDFDDIWYINDGEIPKLHAHKKGTISINPVVTPPITQPSNPTNNKTDLGIQANNLNKVYDGKSVATESDLRAIATQNGYTDIVTISGLKNGDSVSKLGTLRYDGTGNTWQNAKNAGSYTIMPSGLTGGQDYEIKYGEGKLTIDKRPVEAILRGQKTYNTHNQAEIDGQTRFNQNGLIDDTVKFTGSVTLAGKDAGNHNIVDSSKVQITGDGAENYELKSVTGVWKINPQSVDATAIGSKVYDDSAVANIDDTTRVSFSRNAEGVYESDLDKVKLSGSVTLKGKDVGAHTIQDFNNATLTGEAAKNYTLKNLVGRWNITPAPVVITGKSLTLKGKREYDATNNAYAKDVDMQSLNEQLYDSDKGKIKIEGIGKLEDIHVGEQALKDKNTLALTGDAAKNYEIQVSGSKWEITPYTFSLRGNKTYDATTYADAKDVDQRYLDVFLFPNDKGKIQLKGTGSIVAANATSLDKPHKLADKGSLRLTSNTDPSLAKNYQINFDDSGWTVEKRKITATGEKVYNADNRIDAKDLKPSDVDMAPDDRNKGADALRIASGTALLNTKHVHQDGSRIAETGTLKLSGSLADNYELTSGGYVKIQPAVLTVKAVSDTKTYDGTTVSNKTPIVSGLQGADKLIEAKQEFLDKDVLGDGQSILKVGHFKVEDFNNGKNYKVVIESTKGTINPKVITTKFNKVYDGTELINHYHIDREAFHQQLINSDIESVQLVGSGELDNQNSGNRFLKQNRFTLFGKESNNYQIDMKNSQFRIDKRPISLVVRKYADNSTRFDWDPASLDNADNEVELLNVIKNQNNFDEINSFSIEGFSLETASPKAGTYTGKDVTIKTPIKIKNDNYIFDLGNSSGILVQVAQDSNDFDFNTNEGQIVVREVEHEDDLFFGHTDKLATLDLGWLGKHNIVNYRGFQISKPTEKTSLDGMTELTLPIFNTLDSTLEIQVLDENGQIIDRQYAAPHLLTTDVVDSFAESISDLGKEGVETSAVSTETEVKVKVPKGGKIKFTYNSEYAKRNNLVEPIYNLLKEALFDDVSEAQEKELKKIIVDSISAETLKPLIDALGVGSAENLVRIDLQKIDYPKVKQAVEAILNKVLEQLKKTVSVTTGLKIAVGASLENFNSIKIAKNFAEGTTKFLNLLSGAINYTRDLSKYDQEIRY